MGERTLVPFDGSPLARRALDRTLTSHPDAEVTALYVIDPMLAVYEAESKGLPAAETWYDRMREGADDICAEATALASDYDREITTVTEVGQPAKTILEYADDHDIEHIVIGSHGRSGVSRLVLGSVAERVMRRTPIPITIVR